MIPRIIRLLQVQSRNGGNRTHLCHTARIPNPVGIQYPTFRYGFLQNPNYWSDYSAPILATLLVYYTLLIRRMITKIAIIIANTHKMSIRLFYHKKATLDLTTKIANNSRHTPANNTKPKTTFQTPSFSGVSDVVVIIKASNAIATITNETIRAAST